MKCPKCKEEIDDDSVHDYAVDKLDLRDPELVREDLYAEGWRNMEDSEDREEWLEKNASAYGYLNTDDSDEVSDFVAEEAAGMGYIHTDDLPQTVPEEIRRELWQLKLITVNQEITWDDLLHMLRGLS